jgi:hypothetical protein
LLHELVWQVLCRLCPESPDDPLAFLIYDAWIFDIPMLMDIAVLYENVSEGSCSLSGWLSRIFRYQPSYWDDLQVIVPTISAKLEETYESYHNASTTAKAEMLPALVEIVFTLRSFVSACSAMDPDIERGKLHIMLAWITPLVRLATDVTQYRGISDSNGSNELASHVDVLCRLVPGAVVHTVVSLWYICAGVTLYSKEHVTHTNQDEDIWIEQLLEGVLSVYEVCQQHTLWQLFCRNSLLHSLLEVLKEKGHTNTVEYIRSFGSLDQSMGKDGMLPQAATSSATVTTPLSGDDSLPQIAMLSELFPDFGPGYIHAALYYLGGSVDSVAQRLLEGDLPASLREISTDASAFHNPLEKFTLSNELSATAAGSSFDVAADEFVPSVASPAIQSSSVPLSAKGHVGKRNDAPSSDKLLDSQSLAHLQYAALYEDEYDDTYEDEGEVRMHEGETLDQMQDFEAVDTSVVSAPKQTVPAASEAARSGPKQQKFRDQQRTHRSEARRKASDKKRSAITK